MENCLIVGNFAGGELSGSQHMRNGCTVFEKYKSGSSSPFSAFKLFSTDVSSEEKFVHESQEATTRTRRHYRKYTQEEKETAVLMLKNGHDIAGISQLFEIPRRNLLRWRSNGCQRKEGGGRPTDHDLDRILIEKLEQGQIKGEKQIRAFAKETTNSFNFKASKGWYSKFRRRYSLRTGKELSG